MTLIVPFKKLSENAILPAQSTPFDAGYDLSCVDSYLLQPGERKLFPTHISAAIPQGYYGRIAPRSGLAYKHGIDVLAGVIDSGYRGDIGVILINFGTVPFQVNAGDKIAQFIIESCHQVQWQEVDDLSETQRGEGGFGSSGGVKNL